MWTQQHPQEESIFPLCFEFCFFEKEETFAKKLLCKHPSQNIGQHLVTACTSISHLQGARTFSIGLESSGPVPFAWREVPACRSSRTWRGGIDFFKNWDSIKKEWWLCSRLPTVPATMTQNVIMSCWEKRWRSYSRWKSICQQSSIVRRCLGLESREQETVMRAIKGRDINVQAVVKGKENIELELHVNYHFPWLWSLIQIHDVILFLFVTFGITESIHSSFLELL